MFIPDYRLVFQVHSCFAVAVAYAEAYHHRVYYPAVAVVYFHHHLRAGAVVAVPEKASDRADRADRLAVAVPADPGVVFDPVAPAALGPGPAVEVQAA